MWKNVHLKYGNETTNPSMGTNKSPKNRSVMYPAMKNSILTLCLLLSVVLVNAQSSKKKPATKSAPVKAAPAKAAPAATPSSPKSNAPSELVKSEKKPAPTLSDLEKMYSTPGEEHQRMAAREGKWMESITSWASIDAEPVTVEGTCVISMVMGGRYQESRHTADINGMPFEGLGYTGYDNITRKYSSIWMDNMSTGMMFTTGGPDPNTKALTLVLSGQMTDPRTSKPVAVREVHTMPSDNEYKIEMFTVNADGKEFKSMEILMTKP
jgi:hypothetical protein